MSAKKSEGQFPMCCRAALALSKACFLCLKYIRAEYGVLVRVWNGVPDRVVPPVGHLRHHVMVTIVPGKLSAFDKVCRGATEYAGNIQRFRLCEG
jgi:hypothetical protein